MINWVGNVFIESWRTNACISQGIITIKPLSHKEFIHLSDSELPRWGFDHFTGSGGDGGLVPLLHLNTWQFYIWNVILFLI